MFGLSDDYCEYIKLKEIIINQRDIIIELLSVCDFSKIDNNRFRELSLEVIRLNEIFRQYWENTMEKKISGFDVKISEKELTEFIESKLNEKLEDCAITEVYFEENMGNGEIIVVFSQN